MKRSLRAVAVLSGLALLPIAAWSQESLEASPGALFGADRGALLVRSFRAGLVTELGMPALDAASRDAAKLTIKFLPETARQQGASSAPRSDPQQRAWNPSNFRLEVDGLDCRKVSKIDAFTVKQGIRRDGQRGLVASPVVVWVRDDGARSWLDWASTPPGPRRTRTFKLFLADGTPVRDVVQVQFASATVRSARRVEVAGGVLHRFELDCEEPSLVLPGAAPAARAPAPATSAPR